MAFEARILADSVDSRSNRLTTIHVTYPRIVHAEQMTHRVFGRNSASTRAIPLITQIRNLLTNPFVPTSFGINQPGMQAYRHLAGLKHDQAVEIWLAGRDRALTTAIELILGREVMSDFFSYDPTREFVQGDRLLVQLEKLARLFPKSGDTIDLADTSLLNVHKQLSGRGLEAYMWHTVIFTSTEWQNYFNLRVHPDAQGEIATIARLMRNAYDSSNPHLLEPGQWHLPLVEDNEFTNISDAIHASAARCAAVSYNREGVKNPESERRRYESLRQDGHMSPLEHQATPFSHGEWAARLQMSRIALDYGLAQGLTKLAIRQLSDQTRFCGPLRGWRQHRKDIEGEDVFIPNK